MKWRILELLINFGKMYKKQTRNIKSVDIWQIIDFILIVNLVHVVPNFFWNFYRQVEQVILPKNSLNQS